MAVARAVRRYRGWIAAGALVAIAAAAFWFLRPGAATEDTVTYETETAALGTISVTVSGTGNLEVDSTTEVWPSVAGTVASVKVSEGATVSAGDVLFTLRADDAEAATAQALASYRQAQQTLINAESQLLRAKAEYATTLERSKLPTPTATSTEVSIAKKAIEAAEIGVTSATAQRATASDSYEDAKDAEDDLVVTAPSGGIVWTLDVEAGDAVSTGGGSDASSSGTSASPTAGSSSSSSGAPVVLAPAQPLAVHLTVNEVDLPALSVGQRADIEFDALSDLAATGKVYDIADEGTNTSGVVTFDVWLSVDVADPRLRSGMSAAATIVTEVARDALIVSNSALHSDGDGGYYVLVMDAGATEPRQVAVETGLASATQTQILSGIAEGDVVVTQTVDSADTGSQGLSGPGGGMMMGIGGGPRD